MNDLPVISLAALNSNDHQREDERLRECCETDGFFTITDIGVDPQMLAEVMDVSRAFFELDDDKKLKYSQSKQVVVPRTSRGYVPLLGETLHPEAGPDRKQSFDFGSDRPLSGKYFTGPTLAPHEHDAPGFTQLHMQLQAVVMAQIVPTILRSMARGLGLADDGLTRYFEDPILIHRVIYYPKSAGSAGKHTDNGILTILFQEPTDKPSLYVQRQGTWIPVKSSEGHVVVNLGDMLQKWSGGQYVSTPHKVEHVGERSRISIPFFVYPDIDAQLEPFAGGETFATKDVMLANFQSIWVARSGAGRATELT